MAEHKNVTLTIGPIQSLILGLIAILFIMGVGLFSVGFYMIIQGLG